MVDLLLMVGLLFKVVVGVLGVVADVATEQRPRKTLTWYYVWWYYVSVGRH